MTANRGGKELDQAFEGLEQELPDRVSRAIRWLRDPKARWIRIPLGVLLILGGLLWFLPVVGIDAADRPAPDRSGHPTPEKASWARDDLARTQMGGVAPALDTRLSVSPAAAPKDVA